MNVKRTLVGHVLNVFLIATILAGVLIPRPAAAQAAGALAEPVVAAQPAGVLLSGASGSLSSEEFDKAMAVADAVTRAVILDYGTGRAKLDATALSGLDSAAKAGVKRFVSDLNAGRIGIAVVSTTGETTLFGNPAALTAPPLTMGGGVEDGTDANTWARDSWGLHIYLDKYWTNLLVNVSSWAVGVIAGVVAGILCSSGIGCLVLAVVVSAVWEIVSSYLKKYKPTTMAFRFPYPWKSKYLHITMYRPGYWYHNQWLPVKRIWR